MSILVVVGSLAASGSAAAAVPAPIDIAPGIAWGINDHGQVVGGELYKAGWVWKQGAGLTVFNPVDKVVPDTPRAINEKGMVVGTEGGGHSTRGWVWTPASGTVLLGNLTGDDFESTNALDVNESGQIAGMRGNGRDTGRQDQAVRWTPEGWMGVLAPRNSFAAAINGPGQIVGTTGELCSWLCGGHAVLWQPTGEQVTLGDLPGAPNSQATDINDSGQVVGTSGNRAFLWTQAGGMVDLGTLPGADNSGALGINDSGQVVGSSGGRAFLWTQAAGMVELPSLSGSGYSAGYAINNQGQIAGTSAYRAVMWFGDSTPPTARLNPLRGEKLADVRSRGLRLQLTTSEPGSVEVTLSLARTKKQLATKTVSVPKAGVSAVTFKLDRKVRVGPRKLRKATFVLRTATRDLAGNSSVATTKLTIKR